jgi:hypothetical protein
LGNIIAHKVTIAKVNGRSVIKYFSTNQETRTNCGLQPLEFNISNYRLTLEIAKQRKNENLIQLYNLHY